MRILKQPIDKDYYFVCMNKMCETEYVCDKSEIYYWKNYVGTMVAMYNCPICGTKDTICVDVKIKEIDF